MTLTRSILVSLLALTCIQVYLLNTASGATYTVAQANPAAADSNPGDERQPWKTLGRACVAVVPGDTVLIGDGIYREQLRIERSGTAEMPIRFEAMPGANVVVSGADRVVGWKADHEKSSKSDPGTVYVADWPHSFVNWSPHHTHPDDNFHRLIGRCEQVFVFGYPLRQVLDPSELARGTFYVDLSAKRLYARSADDRDLSNGDAIVEASARDVLLDCKGAFVTIKGIHFRYAANRAQEGAALFSGAHDVIEACTFERTNSEGATFLGEDQIVRHCTFRENGQLGFGANHAHRLLMTDCEIRDNNTKGFDRGWEGGGDKLVLCRGAVLDHCVFANNRGNGIWFDIGNEDCEVRNCLIENNEDAGIFDEISFGLKAHDNVIAGNGFAGTPGSWGAAAGICLSSSPQSVIQRNLIIGNKEGFNFREQNRTTPRIDSPAGHKAEEPVWNHDEVIANNVFAYNRDAQVWGWFDVSDNREWPATAAPSSEHGNAPTDIASKYKSSRNSGPPPGTDLKALHLQFTDNLYAIRPSEGLFNWGVPWKRHIKFTTLDDVRHDLALEPTGQIAELTVRDPSEHDYRTPADSAAIRMKCYPRGGVPSAVVGTEP